MPIPMLSTRAHSLLIRDLTSYGNSISPLHGLALGYLIEDMTAMASGELEGRWCHALPTGAGKSSAIVAWITALHLLGPDHQGTSVAVSASKVEALCEMKRDLLAHGVPASQVGLVHSYKHDPVKAKAGASGFASEPSEGRDRRFVLVTHARCRSETLAFNEYQGRPRSLLVYDESLLVSAPTGLSTALTLGAISWCLDVYRDRATHADLLCHLAGLRSFISDNLADLRKAGSGEFRIVTIPQTDRAGEWQALLPDNETVSPVRDLLELSGRSARLTLSGGGGVLSYEIAVPPTLDRVLILDASWPIRQLERSDPTIHDATEGRPHRAEAIQGIKSFEAVTLHHMALPGGREAITKAFGRGGTLVHEVVKVVSGVPAGESVLIVTYKQRGPKGTDFQREIRDALEATGIDTEEKVPVYFGDEEQTRDRFNFTTWGNECGSNAWNHAKHVLLVGILHRSHTDLMASLVGQADNLSMSLAPGELRIVERSELVHLAYQALSRGACRRVQDGKAEEMHGYIIERDHGIRAELSKVMPGVVWKEWGVASGPTQVASAAGVIVQQLKRIPAQITKLSTSALKKSAGLTAKVLHPNLFTAALREALALEPAWSTEGRSLVRYFPPCHPPVNAS